MNKNEILSSLNALYWFKDQLHGYEEVKDYLLTLRRVADEMDFDGLVGDIDGYLLELNGR